MNLFTENIKLSFWLFVGVIVCYILLLPLDIMDVDAAQYAGISQEMSRNNSFLQVLHKGADYLDKPPLLFWLSAISIKLLGFSNVAYRLPSLFIALLGIYATFRLANIFSKPMVARLAALLYATIQAVFLMINDVKTDTLLTAFVILSIWMFVEYYQNRNQKYWVGFAVFVGLGMLTKGPIGLIAPMMAITPFLFFHNDVKFLFHFRWILFGVIILLLLSPMMIGLYQQFDAHPEKITLGRQGVSGLRFYFWEQSFGRITGENVWKNNPGYFFLSLNTLWAFLPYTLILFIAFGFKFFELFRSPFKQGYIRYDYIPFFGFILPLMALSTSKYQLPHYAYIAYPFGAIMCADYLYFVWARQKDSLFLSFIKNLQWVILITMWILLAVINLYFFPLNNLFIWAIYIVLFLMMIYLCASEKKRFKTIFASILTAIGLNFMLAVHTYPALLKYQFTNEIGRYIRKYDSEKNEFFTLGMQSYQSLDCYAGMALKEVYYPNMADTLKKYRGKFVYFVCEREGLSHIKTKYPNHNKVILEGKQYSVQLLTADFLFPTSRDLQLKKLYLVRMPN